MWRAGDDQRIESLAAGGLGGTRVPPEAVAILAFTMSQSSPCRIQLQKHFN